MPNPLLEMTDLPPFNAIKPEHVEPALDAVLAENRAEVARLLAANREYTWDNLVYPLEALDDRLNRIWSPVSHMNAVVNNPELREAYEACSRSREHESVCRMQLAQCSCINGQGFETI